MNTTQNSLQFWLSDNYKNRCILFRNQVWSIEQYTSETTGNPAIAVISVDGKSDFPIIYWEVSNPFKRVAFDSPEMIPEYIRKTVKSFAYHMRPK